MSEGSPAAQRENVWVVVDGVGNPCTRLVQPRVTQDLGIPPALPDGLDAEFGPYRVVAYMLVPA